MIKINIWDEQLAEAENNFKIAELELKKVRLEKQEAGKRKGIEIWLGYTFESSSGLTPEFAEFAKDIKKHISDRTKEKFDLLKWSRGHFEFSGFLKNKATKKIAYFSCSDVRFFPNSWYNNLLIRTAEHEEDYTGGSNFTTSLPAFIEKAIYLT